MERLLKKEKLFLLILFVFGMAFLFSYGEYLDQESEKKILFSNILAYCNELTPQIGFCKELADKGIIDIRESIEKDHGMSVFYPIFWINGVDNHSTYWGNIIWHLYIYLFCCIGVIALYCLLRELFSKKAAVITTLLYFFTPRIFAEMHYNNKDMIVLSLVLIMLYLGYRLLVNTSFTDAILFGIAGAFVANMKIIGLFIWGFVGICVAIIKLLEKQKSKYLIVKVVLSILSACVVFMVITPAAWGDIIGYFKYVIESAKDFRWEGTVLFNGSMIKKDITGFPRSYLPVTIATTLPIGIMLLIVAGGISSIWRLLVGNKTERNKYIYLFVSVCGGLIPLVYAILNATPLYNGWRHFYFIYSALILLVGCGVDLLLKKVNAKLSLPVLLTYILVLTVGVIINHPYQYAFVNLFAGQDVEEKYELDYWELSVRQALEYILETDEDGDISIATGDSVTMIGFNNNLHAINPQIMKDVKYEYEWENAEYVIINRTYSRIYQYERYLDVKDNMELVYRIKAYGNTVCEVYCVNA